MVFDKFTTASGRRVVVASHNEKTRGGYTPIRDHDVLCTCKRLLPTEMILHVIIVVIINYKGHINYSS